MFSVAVCDDEKKILEQICELTQKYLPSANTAAFSSGTDLLSSEISYDIILLDIQMEGIDGIETARRLRESGSKAVIIFISCAKEYVFKAFDVAAFNYLLKPIDEEKFREVIDKAVKSVGNNGRTLFIKTRGKSFTVNTRDILYLENEMRKIAVHTQNDVFTFYGAMSEIEDELGDDFFRCHRGYLVNMAHIAEYNTADIYLTNGAKVYLSKEKYAEFVKTYMRFLYDKGAFNV